MYTVIKSKKNEVTHNLNSNAIFCSFIDNQHVLILLASAQYIIAAVSSQHQSNIAAYGTLNSTEAISDCRRIENKICAILTQQSKSIILIKYESQTAVRTELHTYQQFFQSLSCNSKILRLNSKYFAIQHEVFQDSTVHFQIYKKTQNFEYTSTTISEPIDYFSSSPQIIKALAISAEIAIFKQTEIKQSDWQIKLIDIENPQLQKYIYLSQNFEENHLLIDLQAVDQNDYRFFIKQYNIHEKKQKISLFRCLFYQNSNKNLQKIEKIIDFDAGTQILEIICVNEVKQYLVLKTLALIKYDGQYYDNFLQVIDFKTGLLIQKAYCSLKQIEMSPNGQYILDYNQEMEEKDTFWYHIRLLFSKKKLYHFIINHSEQIKSLNLNNHMKQMILNFL